MARRSGQEKDGVAERRRSLRQWFMKSYLQSTKAEVDRFEGKDCCF